MHLQLQRILPALTAALLAASTTGCKQSDSAVAEAEKALTEYVRLTNHFHAEAKVSGDRQDWARQSQASQNYVRALLVIDVSRCPAWFRTSFERLLTAEWAWHRLVHNWPGAAPATGNRESETQELCRQRNDAWKRLADEETVHGLRPR